MWPWNFDRWPWNIIRHVFHASKSYVCHFIVIREVKLELPYKRSKWSQIVDFSAYMTVKIWRMTSKNNSAPLLCHFKLCASFLSHLCIQPGVTVLKYPNWNKIYFTLCDLDFWPLILTFCMDIIFVNGNYSWKFHDDKIRGTLWKRCDRQTDRQTDGQTGPFIELADGRS